MHPKAKQKIEQKKIAEERIKELFKQAEMIYTRDKALAHRYAQLIRKIQLKFKIKLPLYVKRRICKKCDHFLKPGENCKIRTKEGKIIIHCLDCKHMMRIPYTPRK